MQDISLLTNVLGYNMEEICLILHLILREMSVSMNDGMLGEFQLYTVLVKTIRTTSNSVCKYRCYQVCFHTPCTK